MNKDSQCARILLINVANKSAHCVFERSLWKANSNVVKCNTLYQSAVLFKAKYAWLMGSQSPYLRPNAPSHVEENAG